MIKPVILHNNSVDFRPPWMRVRWLEFFDLEIIDQDKTYDPAMSLIWVDYLDRSTWYQPWIDKGFRLVCNYHLDSYEDQDSYIEDRTLHLHPHHWPWMHENFLYTHMNYRPIERDPKKFFLLLMNLRRGIRDQLYNAVESWLPDSLYSYVGRGIVIPGDQPKNDQNWQRYYNPDWYQTTAFSLVSETTVENRLFVSEKSFKPIAFGHPFVIYGTPGNLQYLRDLGFETFENEIDESYDNITDSNLRLQAVCEILQTLYTQRRSGQLIFGSSESQQKIKHNLEHFYNNQLVQEIWNTQVIKPVLEFVNA
jgi:hypothetical protein